MTVCESCEVQVLVSEAVYDSTGRLLCRHCSALAQIEQQQRRADESVEARVCGKCHGIAHVGSSHRVTLGPAPVLIIHRYECGCGRSFYLVPGIWLVAWGMLLVVCLPIAVHGRMLLLVLGPALALWGGAVMRVRANPSVRGM